MSLDALIPSNVLTGMVEETLQKSLVFGDVVNTDYEGVISAAGDSVRIPVIGDVTITDHNVNDTLTYESLDAADMLLKIDQRKRFSFAVDIVDQAQSSINIAQKYADRAAYQLRDAADQFIAAKHIDAGIVSGLGTTATPLTVTAAATAGANVSVYEVLSKIATGLDNANVPQEGRFIVIPPWMHGKMILAGMLQYLKGDDNAYLNGSVGRLMGFDIRMSTNCVNAKTAGSKIMAGTMDAISFAGQLLDIETLQLETKYGTGVRGLYVYGAKVIQADALAVATLSEAAG